MGSMEYINTANNFSGGYKRMGRKKRVTPEPKLNYDKMNHDLKLACHDLQVEMFRASRALEIDDLLLGANDAYINGFWTGYDYRVKYNIGVNEIFDKILGKD